MYSNHHQLPLSIALWLITDDYKGGSDDPKTISVTALLRSPRQIILSQRVAALNKAAANEPKAPSPVLMDVMDKYASRDGQAFHKAIEDAWLDEDRAKANLQLLGIPASIANRLKVNPQTLEKDTVPVYLEQRTQKEIGGWIITGAFDFVMDGQIQDFKRTSTFSYTAKRNDEKYTLQGSMYRWLNPQIVTKDSMAIVFLFKDWTMFKVNQEGYPSKPIDVRLFPLKSIHQTEQFILEKIRLIEHFADTPEPELPYCTDDDLWKDEPKYKYYKSGVVGTRSTRTYDTMAEARKKFYEDGSVGLIVPTKMKAKACIYCAAAPICSQRINEITV